MPRLTTSTTVNITRDIHRASRYEMQPKLVPLAELYPTLYSILAMDGNVLASDQEVPIIVLPAPAFPIPFLARHYLTAVEIPAQALCVILITDLDRAHPIQKLRQLLTLRLKISSARSALRHVGCQSLKTFAVVPNFDNPYLLYALQRPSAAYARRNLVPARSRFPSAIRALLARLAGCDVSTGGIIIAGRMP